MRHLRLAVLVLLLAGTLAAGPMGRAAPALARPAATLEVGTSPLCAYHTIAAAIAAANPGDTIKMENTIFYEAPLVVDKDLTLAGSFNSADPYGCLTLTGYNYTTIRPATPSGARILAVNDATVTVSWTIIEGNTSTGGGVAVTDGTLNLENVKIQNNRAYWGAGLNVARSVAELTDCEFNDNLAESGGGGLDVWGNTPSSEVHLVRVAFQGNEAVGKGGAMLLEEQAQVLAEEGLTIGGDSSSGNHAGQDGGGVAILDWTSSLVVNSFSTLSTISYNSAGRHGGGIYSDGGLVTLSGWLDPGLGELLVLAHNEADWDGDGMGNGGAIYGINSASIGTSYSYIADNEAQNGGALFIDLSSLWDVSGSRLYHNIAAGQGGGLWLGGSGSSALVERGTVIGGPGAGQANEADEGGGIYAGDGSTVVIDQSAVRGNYGWTRGAGVCVVGGSTLITWRDSAIDRNQTPYSCQEGGGIFADGTGTRVQLDETQVTSNTVMYKGGGLYVGNGAVATVRNGSVVRGNSTDLLSDGGGGIYVLGASSVLTVTQSAIRDNSTAMHGGGISNWGGTVILDRAGLDHNYAHYRGGGMFSYGGDVTIRRSSISHNQAEHGNGGGLFSEAEDAMVEQCSLVGNTSTEGSGGAIATLGSEIYVWRDLVALNSSPGEGSALYLTAAGGTPRPMAGVVNSFVVDNETTGGSAGCCSAVYVENVYAMLTYDTLARQTQGGVGVQAGNDSIVSMVDNIVANFATGIRRPADGTGVATAWHTLYYDNVTDYDPDVTNYYLTIGDPAFVGGGDYHLTPSSAALDIAADTGVYDDYDGQARPWGLGYDIGADEYAEVQYFYLPLVFNYY